MIDTKVAAKQIVEEAGEPTSTEYDEQFIPFSVAQIRVPLKGRDGKLIDPVRVVSNLKMIRNTIDEILLELDRQNRSATHETRQRTNRRMLSTVYTDIQQLNRRVDVRPKRRRE